MRMAEIDEIKKYSENPDHPGIYNPLMEAVWGAHLRSLGLSPGPACLSSPNGVYYFFGEAPATTDIQLVIAGPMKAPRDYAEMIGDDWRVVSRSVLPAAEPGNHQAVNDRGFWVVWLRQDADLPERELERE